MRDFKPFQYEETIRVIDRIESSLHERQKNFEDVSANMTYPDWFDHAQWHKEYKIQIDYCQAWIDKIRRRTNEARNDRSMHEDKKDREYHDLRKATDKVIDRLPKQSLGLGWQGGEINFDRIRNYLITYDLKCGGY